MDGGRFQDRTRHEVTELSSRRPPLSAPPPQPFQVEIGLNAAQSKPAVAGAGGPAQGRAERPVTLTDAPAPSTFGGGPSDPDARSHRRQRAALQTDPTEQSTGFLSYNSLIPKDSATIRRILQESGNALRDQIFAHQKRLGVIPPDAKLPLGRSKHALDFGRARAGVSPQSTRLVDWFYLVMGGAPRSSLQTHSVPDTRD